MTIKDEQGKQADLPKARPARPKAQPARPKAQPARPKAQPAQPKAPAANPKAQPARPKAQPARPKAQPARPKAQPAQPKARPAREAAGRKESARAGGAAAGESAVAADGSRAGQLPPPRTIRIAVLLMYAGAALTAVGLALSAIAVATGEKSLRASHPHATVAQLHATQHVLITVAVASGIIEIAAWLLLARANRGGLKWARIVATVLFALSTANLAGHLHGSATIGNTIYSIVIWLVGLATIVLLWLRPSSTYFAS